MSAKLVAVNTETPRKSDIPIRPAATIALLRDRPGGPEVFMLRRSAKQVFAADAYVYPGGRVEPADANVAIRARYNADAVAAATSALGVDDALGYWQAAARECFEEAGVLPGCSLGTPQSPSVLHSLRDQLNAGARSWHDIVNELDLHFDIGALHYFAFWTTPTGMPRRFSTRFFMARMPSGQQAVADGAETTQGEWLQPAAALQRHEQGDIKLMRPTVVTLRQMSEYVDTDEAFADVSQRPVAARP